MTIGEKMVWAATFSELYLKTGQSLYAADEATGTVTRLRDTIASGHLAEAFGEDSEVVQMAREMLS